MPKWDRLKPLPQHVVAPLLRALACIARRPESRLVLQPAREARPPFYNLVDDYNVMHRGRRVGRISFNHKPYADEMQLRWRWFLNDTQRNRMADGRTATRAEAMAAFRHQFDTLPDDTIAKTG